MRASAWRRRKPKSPRCSPPSARSSRCSPACSHFSGSTASSSSGLMLKVWGRPTSTNTQRVLWALAEAEVAYELTLASGSTGAKGYVWRGETPFGIVETAEYRAMNPNGTIPTIKDGDFTLWESNAVVAYLARRYAPGKLYGSSEAIYARALQWMIWTNC